MPPPCKDKLRGRKKGYVKSQEQIENQKKSMAANKINGKVDMRGKYPRIGKSEL
jgi:hypothetical protein